MWGGNASPRPAVILVVEFFCEFRVLNAKLQHLAL